MFDVHNRLNNNSEQIRLCDSVINPVSRQQTTMSRLRRRDDDEDDDDEEESEEEDEDVTDD